MFFLVLAIASAYTLFQLFPSVGNGRNSVLFTKHPISSKFHLKAGDFINMPWHVYDARSVLLIGEVTNRQPVDSLLRDLGLYPLESGSSHPLVAIGAIQYLDGAAGAYNETFVSCFASKSPASKNVIFQYLAFLCATNPHFNFISAWLGYPDIYMVVWKMHVDTDLSLRGGREIWGYPKDLAEIYMNPRSEHPSINEINLAIGDTNVFSIKKTPPSQLLHSIFLPANLIGHTVTPRRFLHSIGETEAFSKINIKPFISGEDSVTFNTAQELGKELYDLDFIPWLWYDSPVTEIVLKAPYYYE